MASLTLNFGKWCFQKSSEVWEWLSFSNPFVKIIKFLFVLPISILLIGLGAFLFIASFMTIFNNIIYRFFEFSKDGFELSGVLGKTFYLPCLCVASLLALGLIVLSVGQAVPFDIGD